MSIRELAEHDLPALLALYAHLHDSDLPLPPAPIVRSVWDSIRSNDSIRYFGAFTDSQLVSACNITVIPNLTRGCAPYGVIENVVTHKLHRGHGHGTAVLKAALEFAWTRQCYKVMLMTGRLDASTFSFYEKAGFKRHQKEAFIAKPEHHGV
jgi:GNAT superfamily N-acetyltransferase